MTSPPAKKQRIGPHSRAFKDGSLGLSIDGRSSEGRYLWCVIAELTAQLGRAPTFAEGLLIRRAARASLILDLFNSKIMAGEAWTQVDANTMGGEEKGRAHCSLWPQPSSPRRVCWSLLDKSP